MFTLLAFRRLSRAIALCGALFLPGCQQSSVPPAKAEAAPSSPT